MKEYIAYGAAAAVLISLLVFAPGQTIAAFLILVFLITEPEGNRRKPLLLRPFLRKKPPQQSNDDGNLSEVKK
ncbi:hypothetical protein L0156_11940 [bacterium]|nr:hypothetical protein [bacterium]